MTLLFKRTLLALILFMITTGIQADVDNKSLDDYLKKSAQGSYDPPPTKIFERKHR